MNAETRPVLSTIQGTGKTCAPGTFDVKGVFNAMGMFGAWGILVTIGVRVHIQAYLREMDMRLRLGLPSVTAAPTILPRDVNHSAASR